MKIAYIVGPYRAKTHYQIEENIRKAEAYAIKYWLLGFACICPHKNTAHFDGLASDEIWLQGDLEIMKRCDVIVVIPGWKNSIGSCQEIAIAKKEGIEIIYEAEE